MSEREIQRRRDAIHRLARELRTQDAAKLADLAGRRGILRGLAFGSRTQRELEVALALSEMRSAELFPAPMSPPQGVELK